eukprot:CAMPEP_0201492958 /NCGR_PEP_ID=MMETSP0151_2-20130828/35504_1 /ASSEMBLY_ACC=CAM_ASM_000257 /TAXON_ID=200890 /ORGANISM="Paramoeba atlantica, Strain 621/1 / CCAP 1560/9" /LENGTH=1255 /DNA_ID=CAMNT_0047880065 /DNA_START=84 /DNA_END=3848 /DNA_ORIENTATION=-
MRNNLAGDLLGYDEFIAQASNFLATPSQIDGASNVAEVATALGNVVHPYILALGSLVRAIELRYGDPRGLDPSTVEEILLAEDVAATVELEFSSRVNTTINTTASPVKYAPTLNQSSDDFLLAAFASSAGVELTQTNWDDLPNLKYQYFASDSGFIRYFPAFQWPDEYPDYDPRLQSWYANAASGPKTVVLLIKRGFDYGEAIDMFLNTLSQKDFLQIVSYSDNQTEIPPCFSVVPSQLFRTSTQNQQLFADFVFETSLSSHGEDNSEQGFEAAFLAHSNTFENPTYPNCIPQIIWLPDPEEIVTNDLRVAVAKMRDQFLLEYGREMLISIYQLDQSNQFAQRIACESSGGEYQGDLTLGNLGFSVSRFYLMVAQSIRSESESSQFVESAQFTFRHSSFLTTTFRPDGEELTPRLIFSIVQPVYAGRIFIGTIGLEFETLELQQELLNQVIGATGDYILSDQQADTIVHPNMPSVSETLPDQLIDLRFVETTPAFYTIRTGIVDGVAGSRTILAIQENAESQQSTASTNFDWTPITDVPLSVAVGRNQFDNQIIRLEALFSALDLSTQYFVSAFLPLLDPSLIAGLSFTTDPNTGSEITYDVTTFNIPPSLYESRITVVTMDGATATNIHNYLNDVPGTQNSEIKAQAKSMTRVFSTSGLENFWITNRDDTNIIFRTVVFMLGESAIYPGQYGGDVSEDLRNTGWFQRAIDFLPEPVPSTQLASPVISLSPAIRQASSFPPISSLSLVFVHNEIPAAVMGMDLRYDFFWESLVSSLGTSCYLSGGDPLSPTTNFCVLLDNRGYVLGDTFTYDRISQTDSFFEPTFLGDDYPGVAQYLISRELLIQQNRNNFFSSTSSDVYFLNAVFLDTIGVLEVPLDNCATATQMRMERVPNSNFFILTLSSDYTESGCDPIPAPEVVPFEIDACSEATFAYRSPIETENCPYPLFFSNETLDNYREANYTCGDLDEYFIPDWIHWSDSIAIAMVSVTAIIQLGIFVLMLWIAMNQDSPVIRMASPVFCLLLLFGCEIGVCAVYFLTGEPTDNICRARAWFFCLGFSLMFSALFAKTWRLHRIYLSARDFKNKPISVGQLLGVMFVGMLPTIILLILWSAIDSLEPRPIDDDKNDDKVIIQCQSDNQWVWQGLLIAVNALLVLYGCYVSIITRKIQLSFNESRYIALAIYNVAVLAPVGIAIGSGLENILIAWYAILCACILVGAFLCVFVLFAPKLRVHYLTPDKNTLESTGTGGGLTGTSVG